MPTTRRHLRFGFAGALAFSFALHAACIPFVRVARASDAPAQPDAPLTMSLTSPHVAPSPTPQPRVTSTPPPRSTPPLAVRTAVDARTPHTSNVPRTSARITHAVASRATVGARSAGTSPGDGARVGSGPGGDEPAAAVLAGAPDAATPTSSPIACERPDADARVVVAVAPDMPEIARERQGSGTVAVRVDLSETGAVESASIAQSSDPAFDAAALDAARRSTYAPAVSACRARGGSYLFRAEFDG